MNTINKFIEPFISNIGLNPAHVIFGNTFEAYIKAVVVFVALLVVFKIFQLVILRNLHRVAKKTKTDIDDTLIEIIKSLRPPFYSFLAFYFAIKILTLPLFVQNVIHAVLIIWVMYQIIIGVQILINYVLTKRLAKDDDPAIKSVISVLGTITKILLWAVGGLMILSNLGINVTSLIAGLGIGGIAVAFALQNILSDLFSSFAIYFDKPFSVGDFITVGEHSGTVEKIGIKTTRIRSTTSEQIIISNSELTSARIKNFKRLTERRALASVGVLYETPIEKVEKIPVIIQKVVEGIPKTRFDRVHFTTFGDFALTFSISYYVLTTDYKEFLDTQEQVNINIMREFKKEEIEFAYPTQKIFLAKE